MTAAGPSLCGRWHPLLTAGLDIAHGTHGLLTEKPECFQLLLRFLSQHLAVTKSIKEGPGGPRKPLGFP